MYSAWALCSVWLFGTPQTVTAPAPRLLCPWDSPGKDTGVGYHFVLQRIFPTQGSNPYLLSFLQWQADPSLLESPGKHNSTVISTSTESRVSHRSATIIAINFEIFSSPHKNPKPFSSHLLTISSQPSSSRQSLLYLKKLLLLKYSWFTMLCSIWVYSKMN